MGSWLRGKSAPETPADLPLLPEVGAGPDGAPGSDNAAPSAEAVEGRRMRTPVGGGGPVGTARRLGHLERRRSLSEAGLALVARREESALRIQEGLRDLGGVLRGIQATLEDGRDRSSALVEKLHHVPEILASLPGIADRQQEVLTRLAIESEAQADHREAQTAALAVIPAALERVQAHSRAQLEVLGRIREGLEAIASREGALGERLGDVAKALTDVSATGTAQAAEIRTLGEGMRSVGAETARAVAEAREDFLARVEERDRRGRARVLAVAAGLGLGLAVLGTVAARAGARALRSVEDSSRAMAEMRTRIAADAPAPVASVENR
ncbi:MAG: hypothetical protein L0216_14755 [Planctomycetales bacterium]|nr:hypothetical protein [Planctomycetales bacterium]